MGTRLFVGNLSYNTTEGDLQSLFEQQGTVKDCHVVLDKFTGKPRGFAFVEMSSQEEADKAVEHFNGLRLRRPRFDGERSSAPRGTSPPAAMAAAVTAAGAAAVMAAAAVTVVAAAAAAEAPGGRSFRQGQPSRRPQRQARQRLLLGRVRLSPSTWLPLSLAVAAAPPRGIRAEVSSCTARCLREADVMLTSSRQTPRAPVQPVPAVGLARGGGRAPWYAPCTPWTAPRPTAAIDASSRKRRRRHRARCVPGGRHRPRGAPAMPRLDLALIRVGERTGRLDACLRLLSETTRHQAGLLRDIAGGVAYPVLVVHVAILVFPISALQALVLEGDLGAFVLGKVRAFALLYLVLFLVGWAVPRLFGGTAGRVMEGILRLVPALGPGLARTHPGPPGHDPPGAARRRDSRHRCLATRGGRLRVACAGPRHPRPGTTRWHGAPPRANWQSGPAPSTGCSGSST